MKKISHFQNEKCTPENVWFLSRVLNILYIDLYYEIENKQDACLNERRKLYKKKHDKWKKYYNIRLNLLVK